MSKKLIINADDYGICREVNRAIENLVAADRLRDVSVLANSLYYDEAADFLLNQSQCAVGVHLNVVEGVPLSKTKKVKNLLDSRNQFAGLSRTLRLWCHAPFKVSQAVETEWRAQIELLLKTGLEISHADSHQHIHAFPPFWRILVKLCGEYGIPAVRLPRERNTLQLRRVPSFALTQAANVSTIFFSDQSLIFNRHFLGFKRAGSYGEAEMIFDLKNLKDGVTEMCVHPSVCDGVPYPSFRGCLEYEALSGAKLRQQIAESNIEITTWAELAKTVAPAN